MQQSNPAPAEAAPRPGVAGGATVTGVVAWLAFFMLGWRGLLIPSLIRSVESQFDQTDAGLGTYFLVAAVIYAAATFLSGTMTRRLGYRWTLGLGGLAISVGLLVQGVAATWAVFVLGVVPIAVGSVTSDIGINALVLDLFATSRGRALNLLHLAYALAAMCTPVAVAALGVAGVPWQTIVLVSGLAWLAVTAGLVLATPGRVPPAPRAHAGPAGSTGPGGQVVEPATQVVSALPAASAGPRAMYRDLPLVLLVLAVAIGCYVASETSVSDWLVRLLADLPVGPASVALTLFWAGISAGRLVFARLGDRLEPAGAAAAMALAGAVLMIVAVLAPVSELSLLLFGAVGLAFGPVYPLIVAAAGARLPGRSAAAVAVLTFAAILGVIAYPPLVGFLSVTIGLQAAMVGAAILAAGSGFALVVARRMPVR